MTVPYPYDSGIIGQLFQVSLEELAIKLFKSLKSHDLFDSYNNIDFFQINLKTKLNLISKIKLLNIKKILLIFILVVVLCMQVWIEHS